MHNPKRRYSVTKPMWNRNNKILLVLIIVQIALFVITVLLSTVLYKYLSLVIKIILSVLLAADSIAVVAFAVKTYNRNSFDDKLYGVGLEIFIFSLISFFVSVAIFYW